MALYDGFFDAEYNAEADSYDREYESGDFTGYLAQVIGSGVCVYNNEDSFKVRMGSGAVIISPGYLFIQGYYLKNDADHSLTLPGTGTYAIAAHLSLGKRMIELEAVSVSSSYPDSLVLAIVNGAANTADDTRYNTDICGVIDSAGEMSKKVEYAINYIDNEIEGKLASVQAEIDAQAAKMDTKIAEAQAIVDRIVPPPVGTIKFTAAQNVGEDWLLCNGDFVSESQYPDLVAALGKLTPSADKFAVLSSGEIAPEITNGVIYGGRMWVYSYSAKKLYGVDLSGESAVKEIEVTSEDETFLSFITPTVARPIALSIVPRKSGTGARLFLAQLIKDGSSTYTIGTENGWKQYFLLFYSSFTGNEDSLNISSPFSNVNRASPLTIYPFFSSNECVPYVVSRVESGVEKYYCAIGNSWAPNVSGYNSSFSAFSWSDESNVAEFIELIACGTSNILSMQRLCYSHKNKDEFVLTSARKENGKSSYGVYSKPSDLFYFIGGTAPIETPSRKKQGPVNVVGDTKVLSAFDKNDFPWLSIKNDEAGLIKPNLSLSSRSKVFVDAASYLWGKDIYFIFVGTGIVFSRTLENGSFGYLDTTNILGTITQFGYLDYSEDEETVYILGQDTTNKVKVAKIVLNTLFDYANDGAWLPNIASDGVPAYIKAVDEGGGEPGGDYLTVTVLDPKNYSYNATTINFSTNAQVLFNDYPLVPGTYRRAISDLGTTFTVGLNVAENLFFGGVGQLNASVSVNGTPLLTLENAGKRTATLTTSDYIESGLTLQGIMAKSN